MKPVIAFSIFILCSTSALTAQNNDNKFSKAVDFVNCKTIELSLQQSSNKEALKTFRDNCDCGTFPDYEKIKKAIPGEMTATMALSEEINKIKEDSNTVNSTEAIEYLGKKIFSDNDRYKKIVSFRKNRDADGTFEAFQQEITKKIIEILPPADSEEGVDQNNQKAGTDIKNTDLPHFPPNKGSFIVWQLNILTLILVTAGIAVLFTRIKRSEKKRFADQTTAISKNINRSMSDNEMERSRSQNALLRNINALSARMDRIEEIQKNIMTSYQRTIPGKRKRNPQIYQKILKKAIRIYFSLLFRMRTGASWYPPCILHFSHQPPSTK